MASAISVIVRALNINGMHVNRVEYCQGDAHKYNEVYNRDHIEVHARPYKRIRGRCPYCGSQCPIYDHQAKSESSWRANDLNGVPIVILYQPSRIECLKHGVLTEYMPWVDGKSRFTEGFNNEVAFMALTCPRTVVSQFFGINWRTVGHCIKAAHDRLEPDVTVRLRGLKRICVDETSYRKGHKYMTVVYDLDRNRVAWVHEGFGQSVFEQFCEALSEEERDSIEVIAGDGAKWIDACCKKYFKRARRCVDFFHVVGWVNEALDKVRNSARSKAERDVEAMKKAFREAEAEKKEEIRTAEQELEDARKQLRSMPKKGRPSRQRRELEEYISSLTERLKELKEETEVSVSEEEYRAALEELEKMPKRGRRSRRKSELLTIITLYERTETDGKSTLSSAHQKIIDDLSKKANDIKGTKYSLGMNPENLSQSALDKLKLIEESYPDVYRAYQLKEKIRIILHMKDLKTASIALEQWLEEAENCGISQFVELKEKIARHKVNILNSVELQVNSSRSEATNTTIKALIATARGFRNLQNIFALIYLRCSDLVVPLHNRYQPTAEKQRELRDIQNRRKRQREEEKRASVITNV